MYQIKKNNITIAGAGPAGMTAAIVLAKAGYNVHVFEQHSTVGRRFNDDYQGIENWSRKKNVLEEIRDMGIEPTWWQRSLNGGLLFDPGLRPTNIITKRPLFYLIRRGYNNPYSLDLMLLSQALDNGVEVIFNKRVDKRDVDIFAGGPQGKPTALAVGVTFTTDQDDQVCTIMNDDLAPGGYAYFLVADGQATLATVLFYKFSEAHECLKKSITTIKEIFNINELSNAKYWGGYGHFSIPKSCERNGVLYIGEAAGFQDYLFGFGIRNALVSAHLAAQSIITETSYDELWIDRLLPHMKASYVNRMLYEKFEQTAKRIFWLITGNLSHPDGFMQWLYKYSTMHKVLYSFSKTKIRSRTSHYSRRCKR